MYEFHRNLRSRLHFGSSIGTPDCAVFHSSLTGCIAHDTPINVSVQVCFNISSNVESSWNGFWFSLVDATLPLEQWVQSLCVARNATLAPLVQAWDTKTIDFTSCGTLDWMTGNLWMQITSNTPHVVPTNNMLLRCNNPRSIPVSHRSSYFRLCRVAVICMYMTVSPTVHRCGFSRRNSHALCYLWPFSLGVPRKLCSVLNGTDRHCAGQKQFHSVMFLTRMEQCSRDRSLDNCSCPDRNATLRKSHQLAQLFLIS